VKSSRGDVLFKGVCRQVGSEADIKTCRQVGRDEGGRAGMQEGGHKCRKTDIKRYRRSGVQVYMQSLRPTREKDVCTQMAS
jgi:hypothetical protein